MWCCVLSQRNPPNSTKVELDPQKLLTVSKRRVHSTGKEGKCQSMRHSLMFMLTASFHWLTSAEWHEQRAAKQGLLYLCAASVVLKGSGSSFLPSELKAFKHLLLSKMCLGHLRRKLWISLIHAVQNEYGFSDWVSCWQELFYLKHASSLLYELHWQTDFKISHDICFWKRKSSSRKREFSTWIPHSCLYNFILPCISVTFLNW